MNKLLKDLYDCFYTPPELSAERQEVEECHQTLIKALENRSVGWSSASLTPKTTSSQTLPSTALSLDSGWHGSSPQN